MSARSARVRIEGASLERLISEAIAQGIVLYDVKRLSLKEIEASLPKCKLSKLEKLCKKQNAAIAKVQLAGGAAAIALLKRRAALPVMAVVCACAVGWGCSRVWKVQVEAESTMVEPLRAALSEWGIAPGVGAADIDLERIEDLAIAEFPELRFASVRLRGVTLTLTAHEGDMPPETYKLTPADLSQSDVRAACDAVVCDINVLSGTAAVKPGELVRKGDVLIYGQEKTGPESMRAVQALGNVTGYVWHTGRAEAALTKTVRTRTGALDYHREIYLPGLDGEPWFSYVLREGRGFVNCDVWTESTLIGGVFLPLQLRTQWFAEVSVSAQARPLEDVKAEAEARAYQRAQSKCLVNDTVVDKWTDYSIIEEEDIQAVVTLQTVRSIMAD